MLGCSASRVSSSRATQTHTHYHTDFDQTPSQENIMVPRDLTPSQRAMVQTRDAHGKAEFHDLDLDATLATMTEHPYLFFVPTLAGGEGREGVRDFYRGMMAQLPPDFQVTPVTDTIGSNRIVRELILTFTHSMTMNWLLPDLAPTGKWVEIPLIIIFTFHG